MRILVISDIHANLTALEAVLSEAGEFDATWCLGDLVGYGPDPNECVERVKELPGLTCIIGNHDAAVLKQIDPNSFNPEAREAIYWTQRMLSKQSYTFLGELPEKVKIERVTLAHGSPRHPVWEYLLDSRAATMNFNFFQTPLCFVGHTHLPVLYYLIEKEPLSRMSIPEPNHKSVLSNRTIINPGSVGQPRDRDPRAAYAIYDTEVDTWDYRRVPYDILEVQERMRDADLPDRHIYRLSAGW
jgi:predicted phosphodiesterase